MGSSLWFSNKQIINTLVFRWYTEENLARYGDKEYQEMGGEREVGLLSHISWSRKDWRVMEVLSRSLRNEEASHINIWGKSFSRRRNGKHKDPEIGGPWCIRGRAGRQVWWNRTKGRVEREEVDVGHCISVDLLSEAIWGFSVGQDGVGVTWSDLEVSESLL